jgi:surfeit locus 1 family protein
MKGALASLRAGLAVPTAFALAAFTGFLALGTWQIERKAWKEALIQTLGARLSAAPVPLPAHATWPSLDRAREEFRRVAFRAELLPGTQALVYTVGSGRRGDLTGPGYRVLALTRVADGALVVVDRGFLSQSGRDAGPPDVVDVAGLIDMVGVIRWPQVRGYFAARDDPARNLWFTRDHLAIAAAKRWHQRGDEIAPFFVDLELPAPAGGYPQPDPLTPSIRNEHLQYALTWYGLAAIVLVMYALWLANRASAPAQPLPCGSKSTPVC